MKLIFRGTNSSSGSCPSVYETDRGTLVIQGWRVTDTEALDALADRGLPPHETAVEIPMELLAYLPPVPHQVRGRCGPECRAW